MRILFLCTGNSCRSQMAEGYAHQLGAGKWEVKSAGLSPKGVNPTAIAVMKEDGVDISSQKSTLLTKDLLEWADLLITLCGDANESCPILPKGKSKRHWPFEDPAKASGSEAEILEKFREIRNGIKSEVLGVMAELNIKEDVPIASAQPDRDKNASRVDTQKDYLQSLTHYLWDKPVLKYGLAATATAGLFFIGYKLFTKGELPEVEANLFTKPRL